MIKNTVLVLYTQTTTYDSENNPVKSVEVCADYCRESAAKIAYYCRACTIWHFATSS